MVVKTISTTGERNSFTQGLVIASIKNVDVSLEEV
jgi:hypothetical protein